MKEEKKVNALDSGRIENKFGLVKSFDKRTRI